MDTSRLARWLKRAALGLLGLFVAFWVFMGVGEMIGGDLSGVSHLPQAVLAAGLMWLGRRRPQLAGVVLLGLAVLAFAFFARMPMLNDMTPVYILLVGPLALGGLLFAASGRLAQRGGRAG